MLILGRVVTCSNAGQVTTVTKVIACRHNYPRKDAERFLAAAFSAPPLT